MEGIIAKKAVSKYLLGYFEKAHFVKLYYIAEIGFTQWTNDAKLRHPRFLGIRTDKFPKKVVRGKK